MDLLRRSLCEDSADYESLIANMSIVMSTVDCDESGNFVTSQPGALILTAMFGSDGFWKQCFNDRAVYYNNKSCSQLSVAYQPSSGSDTCTEEAKSIACNPCDPVIVLDPAETGNLTVSAYSQGNGSTPKEIVFYQTNSGGTLVENFYIIIYLHCNVDKYVFWSGVNPNIDGAIAIDITSAGGSMAGFGDIMGDETAFNGGGFSPPAPPAGVSGYPIQILSPALLPTFNTFKEISELYCNYLGCITSEVKLENIQKVMMSFCALLKDRIAFDRVLNKTLLTIGKCDL
jgi:hypothetical protein